MSSIFTLLNDKKVNKDLDNAKGMIMSMKQYYRFNYNINDYIDYYENNEWKVGKIIRCEAKPVRSPENPRDNEAQRQAGGEDDACQEGRQASDHRPPSCRR